MTQAAARPQRWRRMYTYLVVAVVVLAAVGGGVWWYVDSHSGRTEFSAMFPESIGIYPGSDVRVLGVAVGGVDSITPEGTQVKIAMHLNKGVSVRADTLAVVIAPSLVSDRYIELTGVYQPGSHEPTLENGTTIPRTRTRVPVEIDQLSGNIVKLTQALGPNGANKYGALSDLLNVGAANLRGNGGYIKQTIDKLGQAAGTLSNSKDDLFKTVGNLATFTKLLAQNDSSVAGLNRSLASVSLVLAQDRKSFAAALHDLSGALAKVKRFINDNRTLISVNVKKLAVITQTLSNERDSLAQALRTAPLAVDNLINAYDPTHNVLAGRADLNELTLWRNATTSPASANPASAPPAFLPSSGPTNVSGGH
jgi:phospholipid/cholesterol/gamma-HCH transport system substrate-binding protein